MARRIRIPAIAAAFGTAVVVAGQALAGGEKVAFPRDYARGVMYMTLDRPVNPKQVVTGVENVAQFREFYVTVAALDALRKGEPVPSGTVVTMVQYRARLDAQGNPLKDTSGRFVKGELFGVGVMEKRAGWGTEYAPELRNGEWEYQNFLADGRPNEKVKLTTCFQCHKSQVGQDFLFSREKIRSAAAR